MIFVLAKNEPVLFIMLSEKDVADKLRPGNTLYVDDQMLKGNKFGKIIISLGKSDAANQKLIEAADPNAKNLEFQLPQVGPGQVKCSGCDGIMEPYLLFDGKCIVCWASTAKKLQIGSN